MTLSFPLWSFSLFLVRESAFISLKIEVAVTDPPRNSKIFVSHLGLDFQRALCEGTQTQKKKTAGCRPSDMRCNVSVKQQRRRRLRKHQLKSVFALFSTLSRLFHLVLYVHQMLAKFSGVEF